MTIVELYGFPAPLEDDYEGQLRRAGYPVKDIPLALGYWTEHDGTE